LYIASVYFVGILDIEVDDLYEIWHFNHEFLQEGRLSAGHSHDLSHGYVDLFVFLDVLFQEGHHFELKLHLFLLVFSLEDGDIGL
jgi:hypothetical protein